MRADVVCLGEPRGGELALHAETPLLHGGNADVRVDGEDVKRLQVVEVDCRGIEEVGGEADRRLQNRRCVAGDGLVDQERWIQRELVLAANSLERRVVDAVTAAQNRL